jgi:hypothetical protein
MTARSRRSIMAMPPGFGLPLPRFQRGRWPSLRGRRGSSARENAEARRSRGGAEGFMGTPPLRRGSPLPLPPFQRGRWPSLRGRRGSSARENAEARRSRGGAEGFMGTPPLRRGSPLPLPRFQRGRWRERLPPPSETTPEQGVGPLGRPIALFNRKSGLSGSGRGSGGFSIPCLGVSGALMRRKRALFCRRSARFCHGSALMRGTSALFWFPCALFWSPRALFRLARALFCSK